MLDVGRKGLVVKYNRWIQIIDMIQTILPISWNYPINLEYRLRKKTKDTTSSVSSNYISIAPKIMEPKSPDCILRQYLMNRKIYSLTIMTTL